MKKTAFTAAIDQLKQKIITGEWPPGSRIPTMQQISKEIGISVSTIREALRTLESQGNVSIEHGRGMYVRNDPLLLENPAANLKELEDISLVKLLEARILVEPELAALSAKHATHDQAKQIRELADSMIMQMKNGGPFLDTDLSFHRLIAESAQQPVLSRMMESIYPLLSEGRKYTNTLPHMRTKSSNYHVLIAIAIEEKNSEQARQLMYHHINDMLQTLKVE